MTVIDVPAQSPYGFDNLPYGIYSVRGQARRPCVRLDRFVLDLGILLGCDGADDVFAAPSLNPYMAQGFDRWVSVRDRLTEAVTGDVPEASIHRLEDVDLHLPFDVADYVDFYASEHHAANLGRIFRPNQEPLTANWKHLPIGYHGRSSTIVVSGTDIVRPCGQRKEAADRGPVFGPSVRLDIEAELGFVVGAGSALATRIRPDDAERHIFGVVLFNDWSARDIQAWEYVPLGPNLGKSFASTVSPWVVPLLALDAARIPLPPQDPQPLPYLTMPKPWGLDVELEVTWNSAVVSRPPYAAMYWSPAQMLAHLTVNGASTRTGDLFASGTVSGPREGQQGAFIELTRGGAEPLRVGGEDRTFLLDGDEVVLRASAPGAMRGRIGFGEARGRILPANWEA